MFGLQADWSQEIFERYLPYAVAFGLERRWLEKFKRQPDVVPPPWYVPYPRAPRRTPDLIPVRRSAQS